MSMVQAVWDYFSTCPLLENQRILGVDRLGVDPIEYTIDILPSEQIVKRYVDGSSIRQIELTFSSREPYGRDVIQNIQNSEFYEKFADWVEQNDDAGIYPDFGKWKTVRSIQVISSGYAVEVTEKTSRIKIRQVPARPFAVVPCLIAFALPWRGMSDYTPPPGRLHALDDEEADVDGVAVENPREGLSDHVADPGTLDGQGRVLSSSIFSFLSPARKEQLLCP